MLLTTSYIGSLDAGDLNTTSKNWSVCGQPSSWNTAVGAGFVKNVTTAPNASPVDGFYLYSDDLSAGNTMLGLYTEGTAVAAIGIKVVNETLAVRVNGVTKYVMLAA